MQPAHSAGMTQTRAAAPGQYASGPATQEMFAIQTAMPHLPWEEDPQIPNPARGLQAGTSC